MITEDTKKVCEILGIDPDTPDDEVDKAYSAMMTEWHTSPDHAKQRLKELTEVYQRVAFHRDPRMKNDRSSERSDAICAKKDPMVDIIAQSHDRSSTSQSSVKKEKRPTAITVICVISFLGALFPVLFFFFSPLARQVFAQQFGAWSLSYMAFSTIAGLVCTVGLWLMKKWAAYAYIGLAAVNLAVGLAAGQSDIWTSLIAVIIIFFALKHVAKMT
jgi:VIT1/CCC1 family predicted Fe2+/Mn2+ transporter